eukprot:2140285-Pyramimonas_sp.AAC.1
MRAGCGDQGVAASSLQAREDRGTGCKRALAGAPREPWGTKAPHWGVPLGGPLTGPQNMLA